MDSPQQPAVLSVLCRAPIQPWCEHHPTLGLFRGPLDYRSLLGVSPCALGNSPLLRVPLRGFLRFLRAASCRFARKPSPFPRVFCCLSWLGISRLPTTLTRAQGIPTSQGYVASFKDSGSGVCRAAARIAGLASKAVQVNLVATGQRWLQPAAPVWPLRRFLSGIYGKSPNHQITSLRFLQPENQPRHLGAPTPQTISGQGLATKPVAAGGRFEAAGLQIG